MHDWYANFVKNLYVCKRFSVNLVNELGNKPRPGVVPKFSDLEVIALNITAENMSIDSENYLFGKIRKRVEADFSQFTDQLTSCPTMPSSTSVSSQESSER